MYLDVNSMYPSIMHAGMPFGDLLEEPKEGYENEEVYEVQLLMNKKGKYLWPKWKKEYSCINSNIIGANTIQDYIKVDKCKNSTTLLFYKEFYNTMLKMCDNVPEVVQT